MSQVCVDSRCLRLRCLLSSRASNPKGGLEASQNTYRDASNEASKPHPLVPFLGLKKRKNADAAYGACTEQLTNMVSIIGAGPLKCFLGPLGVTQTRVLHVSCFNFATFCNSWKDRTMSNSIHAISREHCEWQVSNYSNWNLIEICNFCQWRHPALNEHTWV